MHWPACAYAHADKCIYFQQDMRLIILTLVCKGFLISGRCHVRFATLVDKKRNVRDDIKYTWTNLKFVRLGIAQTHGWVELAPTVPTSSSQRGLTVNYMNLTLESRSHKMLPSTIHIMWPMHLYTLKLLCPVVQEKIHLQENTFFDLGVFDLDLGSRSHEVLPSTLNIMWPMHRQNLKLLLPKHYEEMRFQENTLFDPWPWGQGHMKRCPVPLTSCDLCTGKIWSCSFESLYGDAFTRKYIIWPWPWGWPWGQGHTKCHSVPSTSCDLCTYKVWSCYVQRFRRRYNYKKRDGRTDGRTDEGPTLVRN